MDDPTTSVDADGLFEPFHISRVPVEVFFRGERFGMSFEHLSSFGGGSQISVPMEVLSPGRQANRAHCHRLEEEHVFVLEGSMSLRLGAKTFELSAGHYVCFPAGQTAGHALINRGDAPCRYLVFGNPHPHDVAVFTETGRVGVKLTGQTYLQSTATGGWNDVDAPAAG